MIKYYTKGDDIIVVAENWSANFDPTGTTEYALDYAVWLSEGNTPEEWSSSGNQ
jgi:hypothetical protein